MPHEDRVCISQFVAPVCAEVPDTATGFFIGFPHVIFAYGAHLARIEVDLLTGAIRVADYLAATDGGRVVNPAMFDQQVHGGVAQGLGYALSEELVTREGRVLNKDLSTYLIPGALDLPEIVSIPYHRQRGDRPVRHERDRRGGPERPAAGSGQRRCRRLRHPPLPCAAHAGAGAGGAGRNTMKLTFILNGNETHIDTREDRRVVDLLREDLGLTGTKEGCGTGECGACTILVDGESRLSCLMVAAQLEGTRVTTVEGLEETPEGALLLQAFVEEGAVQCGFCTPGMEMAAMALLRHDPEPTRERIRAGLSGNLCRCTGYVKIVDAVERAAGDIRCCREGK